jgi:RND family efflux transporter MFP subunit
MLRPKRHVLSRYVLPLVLVAGFLALVAWASRDLVFPPRPVTVMPVLSTTAEIKQEGTPLFKAAGWIEPRPTPVRVPALAPGVVEELLVVQDQPVREGEPVAELVKADAKLTHERALVDLKVRQAELEDMKSQLKAAQTRFEQPVHLQAALGEAEASLAKIQTQLKNLPFELRRAEADLASAQKDYEGKLASKGVVAGVQIDIAQGKRDSAKAMVQELTDREASLKKEQAALSARRDALKTQLELLADELQAKEGALALVKVAEARVEQARVVVAEAKLQLDRMTIRAPVDGRVYQLIAQPGSRFGGGTNPLSGHDGSTVITMYRPGMLQVRVDVRFEDLPKVSLMQPVEIDNPALPQPIIGTVLFISSEANIQKNTLEVKVEIPDPPKVFKPEMLVDVTFLAPKAPESTEEPTQEMKLYVPGQLILQEEAGDFVWVADQSDQRARKTLVQTGLAGSNGLVEIKQGLTMTSRLIVGGIEGLEDGQRIKITGEEASPSASPSPAGKPKPLHRLHPGDGN